MRWKSPEAFLSYREKNQDKVKSVSRLQWLFFKLGLQSSIYSRNAKIIVDYAKRWEK